VNHITRRSMGSGREIVIHIEYVGKVRSHDRIVRDKRFSWAFLGDREGSRTLPVVASISRHADHSLDG
jgi:hypothetical protein